MKTMKKGYEGAAAAVVAAQALADIYHFYNGSPAEERPLVEVCGTYTAQFILETASGRFRVDVRDIN
jgi:hypothetical protein